MKCCSEDQPNCRHLEKCRENWDCSVSVYQMDECNCYETEAKHEALQEIRDLDVKVKEFLAWRKRCLTIVPYVFGFVTIIYAFTLWWIL